MTKTGLYLIHPFMGYYFLVEGALIPLSTDLDETNRSCFSKYRITEITKNEQEQYYFVKFRVYNHIAGDVIDIQIPFRDAYYMRIYPKDEVDNG